MEDGLGDAFPTSAVLGTTPGVCAFTLSARRIGPFFVSLFFRPRNLLGAVWVAMKSVAHFSRCDPCLAPVAHRAAEFEQAASEPSFWVRPPGNTTVTTVSGGTHVVFVAFRSPVPWTWQYPVQAGRPTHGVLGFGGLAK